MASAFRSLFTNPSRFAISTSHGHVPAGLPNRLSMSKTHSHGPIFQNSKLATIAPGRIFFRSKHIDYTQKYAEKLKRKAQEEGVATVEELKAKLLPATQTAFKKVQLQESKPSSTVAESAVEKKGQIKNAEPSAKLHPAPESGSPSLDKLMKLDLIQDLDPESISKIWIQKHMDQEDTISAAVPADTYKKMLSRSKEYPM
ncbi:hypothetical protein BX616_002277, partial [Lobosporangium transversale]